VVPLAAAGFVNGVQIAPLVCCFGLLIGVSIQAAKARGAKNLPEAAEVLRHGFLVALSAGVLLGIIATVVMPFLDSMGQPHDVIVEGRKYWLIMSWSMLPMLLFQALRSYSEALEGPVAPMVIMFGAVALNAGLNWLLIYGNWGCPQLGLTGAAWSTLIARVAMLVVLAIHVERDSRFAGALPSRWWGGFEMERVMRLLRIGLPVAMQLLFEVGAFAGMTVMVGILGKIPLAAHQVAITCNAVAFMAPLGLSMAVAIRVSAAIGAGERRRVRAIGFSALGATSAFMIFVGLVYVFVGKDIVRIFIRDEAVLALAAKLLLVAAVFQFTDGLQVVVSGALRGMSDVKVPTVLTFIAYWIIAVPLSFYFCFNLKWGAIGVWTGLAIGLSLAGSVLTWRFAQKTKVS
jgi:MATE family multidrug resistance protein